MVSELKNILPLAFSYLSFKDGTRVELYFLSETKLFIHYNNNNEIVLINLGPKVITETELIKYLKLKSFI